MIIVMMMMMMINLMAINLMMRCCSQSSCVAIQMWKTCFNIEVISITYRKGHYIFLNCFSRYVTIFPPSGEVEIVFFWVVGNSWHNNITNEPLTWHDPCFFSNNHGSGKWTPKRLNSSSRAPCSTSTIMGGRVIHPFFRGLVFCLFRSCREWESMTWLDVFPAVAPWCIAKGLKLPVKHSVS